MKGWGVFDSGTSRFVVGSRLLFVRYVLIKELTLLGRIGVFVSKKLNLVEVVVGWDGAIPFWIYCLGQVVCWYG